MKHTECIFCNIEKENFLLLNDSAFVINDKYPQSNGHILIIPFIHEENYFNLDVNTQSALFRLLNDAKKNCDNIYKPTGYKVVINSGKSAGQIIMHAHIQLIPNY